MCKGRQGQRVFIYMCGRGWEAFRVGGRRIGEGVEEEWMGRRCFYVLEEGGGMLF